MGRLSAWKAIYPIMLTQRYSRVTAFFFIIGSDGYCKREMQILRNVLHKSPAFVSHKVKVGSGKFCLTILDEWSRYKRARRDEEERRELLGRTACACAEDITPYAGKLVDFDDEQRPVVGCNEHFSARKLFHYRLVALKNSNRSLSMTLIGMSMLLGLPWQPD